MHISNWTLLQRINNKKNNIYNDIFIELFYLDCSLDEIIKDDKLLAFKSKQRQLYFFYIEIIFRYCISI